MTSPASVEGHASLRLFCALTLPLDIRRGFVAWQQSLPRHDARPVPEGNLHVTLAFLGRRPAADVAVLAAALHAAAGAVEKAPVFRPLRYRETRSVGMLVLEDEEARATEFAAALHERLERLDVYVRETRPWLPHVTVLRFRKPPRLSPKLPRLEPFSPSGAAVYHSLLRPGGAQYDVLESVSLGG